jgi:hypothetical protein
LDQRFDFVHNHILHARCHLPINYIWQVCFWKNLNIKEIE